MFDTAKVACSMFLKFPLRWSKLSGLNGGSSSKFRLKKKEII